MKPLLIDLETGREPPPAGGPLLLSSGRSPWQGVYLEHHAGGPIEPVWVEPRKHLLIVQLDQPTVFDCQSGGRAETVRLLPGQVSFFPAFQPFLARSRDTRQYLIVALDPKLLLCAVSGVLPQTRLDLVARHAVDDPLARALALTLKTEVEIGWPGGRWYAESLAHALGIHLVRHYSTPPPAVRPNGCGLVPSQLRRALDFIQAHFAKAVPLEALAAATGLSQFHFARRFKHSTGLAPHRYLVQCRVERAKELLITTDRSLAQIALEVGFCDQSHLSMHFKRAYGVAPKKFLRQFVPRKEFL